MPTYFMYAVSVFNASQELTKLSNSDQLLHRPPILYRIRVY